MQCAGLRTADYLYPEKLELASCALFTTAPAIFSLSHWSEMSIEKANKIRPPSLKT